MPSLKLLNGVAHDIAHHAVSGLSYIHPYLGELCRSMGKLTIALNVLSDSPLPENIIPVEPLALSSRALHQKFLEILERNGFSLKDVQSAVLTFSFSPSRTDDYIATCKASLVASNGKIFVQIVK